MTESNLPLTSGYKIEDDVFLEILRENAGLCTQTAKAIESRFNIKYSRQAAFNKAKNFKDELKDIEEEGLDKAEAGLITLMESETESIKFKALELVLRTKGKKRGYFEKHEQALLMQKPVIINWSEDGTIIENKLKEENESEQIN